MHVNKFRFYHPSCNWSKHPARVQCDQPAGERLRNAHIIVNFDLVLAILSSKRVRQIKMALVHSVTRSSQDRTAASNVRKAVGAIESGSDQAADAKDDRRTRIPFKDDFPFVGLLRMDSVQW